MRDINGTPLGFYDINSVETKRSMIEDAIILEFNSNQIVPQKIGNDYFTFLVNGYGILCSLTLNYQQYFTNTGDTKYYTTIGFSIPITSSDYIFIDTEQHFNNWFNVLPTVPYSRITYNGIAYNLLDVSFAIKQSDGTYKVWRNSSINQWFYSPYYIVPYSPYGELLSSANAVFKAPSSNTSINNNDVFIGYGWGEEFYDANNPNTAITNSFKSGAQMQSFWHNYNLGVYAAAFPVFEKSIDYMSLIDNDIYSLMCGVYTSNSSDQTKLNERYLLGNISSRDGVTVFNKYLGSDLVYNGGDFFYNAVPTLSTGSSLYNFLYFDVGTQSFKLTSNFSFLNDYIDDYNEYYYYDQPINSTIFANGKIPISFGSGLLSSFASNSYLDNYSELLSVDTDFKFGLMGSGSNNAVYTLYQSNLSTFFNPDDLSSDDVRIAVALVPYDTTPSPNGSVEFIASISPLVNIDFGVIPLLSVVGVVFVATIFKMVKGIFD